MKKNNWTLLLFIMLGLLAGTIIAQLLAPVEALSFLTKTTNMSWQPKADLAIFKYEINIQITVNLLSIIFAGIAVWLYRRA